MAKALQMLRNAMATGDALAARAVAEAYVEGFGGVQNGSDRRPEVEASSHS